MKILFTITAMLALGVFGCVCISVFFGISPDVALFTHADTLGLYPAEHFSGDTAYRVLKIIDGDTIKIDYYGKATNVRLIGVDTPETVHTNKSVEVYNKEASNFMKNLLSGESVYLRFDAKRTDIYGRLLAYLYRAPDGLFVNLEIVRQGYGRVYTVFPFKHMKLFRYYGNRAQTTGKGLYGTPQPSTGRGTPQVDVSSLNREGTNEAAKGEVYITRTGKKYHRVWCSSLSKSKIAISLAQAKQRYGPCSRCDPPR